VQEFVGSENIYNRRQGVPFIAGRLKVKKKKNKMMKMMCNIRGIIHQSENIYNSILHIKSYFVEFGY